MQIVTFNSQTVKIAMQTAAFQYATITLHYGLKTVDVSHKLNDIKDQNWLHTLEKL